MLPNGSLSNNMVLVTPETQGEPGRELQGARPIVWWYITDPGSILGIPFGPSSTARSNY